MAIADVPICLHDFEDEDEALEYAVESQVNRRNLTDAEIYRVTRELDKRRQAGRPHKELASRDANSGKSAEETAKKVGTSTRKIEAARTVADNAAEFPGRAPS